METSAQQCARLLAALEELVAEESSLISAEDYAGVTRVQERAAPLIERLVALAPSANDALRLQALAVIALRTQNQERIARQAAVTSEALHQARESRSRLTHVAPVYRSSPPSAVRRLRAQG